MSAPQTASRPRRIQIDWTRCDGHGLCAALLSHRIHLDEWGFPVVREGVLSTGVDDEADIRHAAAVCPALALHIGQ